MRHNHSRCAHSELALSTIAVSSRHVASVLPLQDAVAHDREMEDEAKDAADGGRARSRLVWTPELHERFMNAVNHLGVKHAVPKTILQLMNVEGLTRENVASHLQVVRPFAHCIIELLALAARSSKLSTIDLRAKVVQPDFPVCLLQIVHGSRA